MATWLYMTIYAGAGVSGIHKPVSDCPVDYWSVNASSGKFFRIARARG